MQTYLVVYFIIACMFVVSTWGFTECVENSGYRKKDLPVGITISILWLPVLAAAFIVSAVLLISRFCF